MKKNTALIIILTIACLLTLGQTTPSYPQGLWPLNLFGKFSEMHNQKILAFYDFNRDRYVDILTQSYNQSTQGEQTMISSTYLNMYTWNDKNQIFEDQIRLKTGGMIVQTALITDFDQNGAMDIVFSSKDIEQRFVISFYEIACLDNKCTFYVKEDQMKQLTLSDSLPSVFLIQGQNSLILSNQDKIIVKRYNQKKKQLQTSNFQNIFIHKNQQKLCGKYQHIFYIDYNGDCIQDFVVSCRDQGKYLLQFLAGQKDGYFSYQQQYNTIESSSNMQNMDIIIKDINYDGLPDILFININTKTGQKILQIHYNNADKSTLVPCTIINQQIGFPFDFIADQQLFKDKIYKIQRIKLPISIQNNQIFKMRIGDINNDGYADLVADGESQSHIFINQYCSSSCSNTQYNHKFMNEWSILNIRTFIKYQIKKSQGRNLCQMSFFDFYQDGRLDIFANQCSNNQKYGVLLPIVNSLNLDVFFIKILLLDNLKNDKINEDLIDFRLNSNGGHVDMYVTSLSGQRMPISGDQSSNSGSRIQLPYIHLGLGRTNNYIQQLFATSNRNNGSEKYEWTPIIPNSQLLIIPSPTKWVLKSFISPTQVMSIVVWFVILILIVMGCYIAHLTKIQKNEDKQNEQSFYATLK